MVAPGDYLVYAYSRFIVVDDLTNSHVDTTFISLPHKIEVRSDAELGEAAETKRSTLGDLQQAPALFC